MSIGYMLYRSFGGSVDGSTLQLTPTWNVYFGVHGAIAVVVMPDGNRCFSYRHINGPAKSTKSVAWKTHKDSLYHMVVCFPLRRNILPYYVRAVVLVNSLTFV